MPYIPDNEWTDFKSKVSALDARMSKTDELLKNVKGQLTVQGYSGKRLDINDNIDVVKTLKRITDLETRVTALETP